MAFTSRFSAIFYRQTMVARRYKLILEMSLAGLVVAVATTR
jgi:hypothetical protein